MMMMTMTILLYYYYYTNNNKNNRLIKSNNNKRPKLYGKMGTLAGDIPSGMTVKWNKRSRSPTVALFVDNACAVTMMPKTAKAGV